MSIGVIDSAPSLRDSSAPPSAPVVFVAGHFPGVGILNHKLEPETSISARLLHNNYGWKLCQVDTPESFPAHFALSGYWDGEDVEDCNQVQVFRVDEDIESFAQFVCQPVSVFRKAGDFLVGGLACLQSRSFGDSPRIVSGVNSGSWGEYSVVHLWNGLTGEKILKLRNTPRYAGFNKAFPEWNIDEVFVSGSDPHEGDADINLYNVEKDAYPISYFEGCSNTVVCLDADIERRILISCAGAVRFWSYGERECLALLGDADDDFVPLCCRFFPDQNLLLVGCMDGSVSFWDPRKVTSSPLRVLSFENGINPTGDVVALGEWGNGYFALLENNFVLFDRDSDDEKQKNRVLFDGEPLVDGERIMTLMGGKRCEAVCVLKSGFDETDPVAVGERIDFLISVVLSELLVNVIDHSGLVILSLSCFRAFLC